MHILYSYMGLISISYNTAARGLPDIYARVRIYQANPERGCVITFILHFARPTLRKVVGASCGSSRLFE